MNFTPSRADQCIWLKKNIELNLYEYIGVYVDDLCIAAPMLTKKRKEGEEA